ncbi:MAG TPA: hypothetical protein VHI13_18260, partial [Candidatus Kapabacteria bacterium]|nr:hypothetical protein [Candidatus Kapabacteria bacterium]
MIMIHRYSMLLLILVALSIPCGRLHAQHNPGTPIVWEQKPGPVGGWPLIIVPDNGTGIIYVGMRSGGIYRSLDSGRTWTPANAGLPRLDIRGIHVSGRGDIFAGDAAGGISRSTDAGAHWSEASTGIDTIDRAGEVSVFCEDQDHRTVAIIGRQLYRFDDAAGEWTAIVGRVPGFSATALVADTAGTFYVSTFGSGILRSRSGGGWVAIDSGLSHPTVASLAIDRQGRLYAGTYSGIARSDNHGDTWDTANAGLGTTVPYIAHIQILANGELIIHNSNGLYRSSDRGDHWVRMNIAAPVPGQGFAVAAGDVMLGTTGTLSRCRLSDSEWTASDAGLHAWRAGSVVATPSGLLFAGVGGGYLVSRDHGDTWDTVTVEGAHLQGRMLRLSGNEIVVVGFDSVRFRSTDGGATWLPTGARNGENVAQFAVLPDSSIIKVISSDNTTVQFQRSTNRGESWSPAGIDSAHESPEFCMAVDAGTILVAGNQKNVFRYTINNGILRRDTLA